MNASEYNFRIFNYMSNCQDNIHIISLIILMNFQKSHQNLILFQNSSKTRKIEKSNRTRPIWFYFLYLIFLTHWTVVVWDRYTHAQFECQCWINHWREWFRGAKWVLLKKLELTFRQRIYKFVSVLYTCCDEARNHSSKVYLTFVGE